MNHCEIGKIVNSDNSLSVSAGSMKERSVSKSTPGNRNSGAVKILWSGWQEDWFSERRNAI